MVGGRRGRWLGALLALALGSVSLVLAPPTPSADAQSSTTVTRTLDSGVEVVLPAGKFYKVVDAKTGKPTGQVREGDLREFAVVLGLDPDPADRPDFSCRSIEGTADSRDYVGGTFPLAAPAAVNTLPIATKAEVHPASNALNVWDPSEIFDVLCTPTAEHRDWLPVGQPIFRFTILDTAEAASAPAEFVTVTDTTSNLQMTVGKGKFYSLYATSGGSSPTALRAGSVVEGDLSEFFMAVGEVTAVGDLTLTCTTYEGTAGAADYVGGSYPAALNDREVSLPLVTKSDTVVEDVDEWYEIECLPSSGTEVYDWRWWPPQRIRYGIVDRTAQVRFSESVFVIEEGTSNGVFVVADSKGDRQKGQLRAALSVAATLNDERSADHPGDVKFTGTSSKTRTHSLGTSIQPQALPIEAVDDNVCEYDEVFTVTLSEPSGANWASTNYAILGWPAEASVRIVDDEDPPPEPQVVAAAISGTTLRAEWLGPRCPYLRGVEMEYQAVAETDWTSGLMAGREWDYDGDGDPSNNRQLTTTHSVPGLTAGMAYRVRVRYHNNGGTGPWKETLTGEVGFPSESSGGGAGGGGGGTGGTGGGGGGTGGAGGGGGGGGPSGGGGGGPSGGDSDSRGEATRLWGADRYATSLEIARQVAQRNGNNLDTVVLAGGHSWTDALIAGPLAGVLDAALLLTPSDGLPEATVAWLADLGVSEIIAVGSTGHISDEALAALAHLDEDIERITAPESGSDGDAGSGTDGAAESGTDGDAESGTDDGPYAAAAAVARRIGQPAALGPLLGRTVIVASGQVFADALAAGPLAAAGPHPILYADEGTLHPDVAVYLAEHADHVVIMGGSAAVTESIEAQIRAIPQANRAGQRPMAVTRLGGADRYATAVAFARWLDTPALEGRHCFTADTVGLATGLNPADAAASGPLLARRCAPLLLTQPDQIPPITASYLRRTSELIVFGGTAAINRAALADWDQ